MLAIALAVRQEAGHAFAGHQLQILNLEANQFVAAETAPKAQQYKGAIAQVPEPTGRIVTRSGRSCGAIEPIHDLTQLREL
ncbi:hypothetical protein NY99_21560 [Xanthomonas phaseoli pv. phaseoli]|uniref:Uncharacterized protein n=2 Tax=Xanthomonas axonopodis TaxID=53413 RepID=A0A1T1NT03_9XANT|nr:hypothetical protein J165_03494 [Xanthomonas citri pv. citri]EWC51956.1 hypothetical protein XAR_1254 [Xanthomonas citri pv. glycines str. 8ra]KGU50704.1 hypothetical protein NY99_21560 [Xanthomonas phaseoli pv. phaseoli]OOW59933.1 hypothetical protein Xcnt_19565 [Xanthomonas campestris pv. centellae]OOW66262.1 hypothetical protein Xmlh_19890 [Xanthomonas axonopodis pv. melhusii]OOW76707.1 hypothetical protein Xclt_20745 [Xanthomonas axonopodis pv. clitoriae]OOW94519.1 hypothetical protein